MKSILAPDFEPTCLWWKDFSPWTSETDLPTAVDVLVIGGGYAGLSCALELARLGTDVVVVDAKEIGWGASSRNGGGVGVALSIGKDFTGKQKLADTEIRRLRTDASQAFPLVATLIERERIACHFDQNGGFIGAFTPAHFQAMRKRADELNRTTDTRSHIVEKADQHSQVGSDYYFGGLATDGGGTIHPSLYVKGLLDACLRNGVKFSSNNPVHEMEQQTGGWKVRTAQGICQARQVVVATNGYTGPVTPALQRRIVPIASHIIATEELPEDQMRQLFPTGKLITDSKRILYYYRPSPDGRRVIFGGRARFTEVGETKIAALLHAAMVERFPQLGDVKVSNAWTGSLGFTFDATAHMGKLDGLHYCMGCNGSGIAMMTYLGHQTARKIAAAPDYACAFDGRSFPTNPLYRGDTWFLPLVGSWYRMRDDIDRAIGVPRKPG